MAPILRGRATATIATLTAFVLTAVGLAATPPVGATTPSARVDQFVRNSVAQGSAEFLVHLRARADLKKHGATEVYRSLTQTATESQRGIRAALDKLGVAYEAYWISNALRVTGDRAVLDALAARDDVASIEPVRQYPLITPTVSPDTGPAINAVEWGINNIQAPRVWNELGVRGEGVVVANIDTGAAFNHPALVRQYRGNLGGGSFNHNYNWFDPARVCGNPSLAPCDNNNHGSHTMGTMVGDDGAGNQIGVAPGARWIAAKGCETSSCSSTSLLAAGQWVVAPTDLNGANPRPDLHPDIVNNSWGGGRGDTWYQDTIRAWVTAGIFPAFANGNSGPNCNTANSPGDNPDAYAVGAYDINNAIASFSSRGTSGVNGAIKPNVAAPGVNVRSSVANGGYSNFNGTSMATPHVAGTVALIWSASSSLKGEVAGTKSLLNSTATDTDSTGCGGTAANNNNFGEGRLNAFLAVSNAPRGPTGTLAGTVTDTAGTALAGIPVSVSGPASRSTTTDAAGRYSLTLTPGTYSVTAGGGFYVPQTVTGVNIVVDQTTTRNFALTRVPTGTITGRVTDSLSGAALAGATVVASGPASASGTTDASGVYRLTVPAGTYSVTASLTLYQSGTVTGVVVPANGTATANIVLRPNFGTLTGKITNSVTGAAVPGASITVFGAGGTFRTTSDAAGNYTITRIPAGSYAMHVTKSGFFLGSARPTIVAAQVTVQNVALQPTG
ncbi:MAG TPA: carboxypeptidase regulatory-like domain-containing protein [Candidatus Limnocylindrales bacterium]|nr:carboxypeptidase regulatory-like domain-containing protein [Candidatus Limnocylindrales bacterium]